MKGEIYLNNLPQNPTITPTQTNYAFRYFCQKVLPTVYDESLSYYELLCKLTSKINEVIESSNKNGEAITELQNLYKQLKDYVDNYFSTVDLQDEIDAALNKMAESGDLATIISEYLNGINIYGFRTINDMKNAETIGIGSICRTLGDTDYKTGNGKFYYVRRYLTTDTIDDDNIIALINNPQAVAEKIPDYFYNTITSSIGDLSNLTTTDKTSTVGAINEVKGLADTNATNIGTISNLTTTEKTNTVGAINEVKGLADTNATNIGTISNLTTTEKTNTVGAINEVKGLTDTNTTNIGTMANLTTSATTSLVEAINELNSGITPISQGGTGATTAADALNNLGIPVEYGTWTPTLTNRGQDPDPTYTLGAMEATYAKIGDLVFITMYLKVSITNTGGSTGYCGIGGLPFVNSNRVAMSVYEFDSNLIGTADIVRCGIPKDGNVIIISDKYGMYAMKWKKCNNANISMAGFYRIK